MKTARNCVDIETVIIITILADNMRYMMIDLFSGLGGASQAMRKDSKWTVVSIDNNIALKPYADFHCMSVMKTDKLIKHLQALVTSIDPDYLLIWASPPCIDFFTAYLSPKSKANREGVDYIPDFTLVKKTLEIIKALEPTSWVIENVSGATQDLKPYLGPYKQHIGAAFLWGKYPTIVCDEEKILHKNVAGDKYRHSDLRANYRAMIPEQISQGLKEAIEQQRRLTEWV